VLSQLPKFHHPDLLSEAIPFADAAIFRINEHQALVQSLDFFTPVVDDPYVYGQIAASNSLSDLFAMGAKPLTAMNIVCFPLNCLEPQVLNRILEGGGERIHAAGAVMAGGHSIEDDEPKYGLSVTGIIDPAKMITTCGCQPGDLLYLTKPLGTGLLATALKGEILSESDISEAIQGMVMLNQGAAEAMLAASASACTDITGFGLLGHASELAEASKVGLQFEQTRLPYYAQAFDMAEMGLVPVGSHRNREFYGTKLVNSENCDPLYLDLICDPQTSGGLLIAIAPERAELLEAEFAMRQVHGVRIGVATAEHPGKVKMVVR
jgi:selenide,water dikinase